MPDFAITGFCDSGLIPSRLYPYIAVSETWNVNILENVNKCFNRLSLNNNLILCSIILWHYDGQQK
jgi:hypothetical protein